MKIALRFKGQKYRYIEKPKIIGVNHKAKGDFKRNKTHIVTIPFNKDNVQYCEPKQLREFWRLPKCCLKCK